MIGYLKKEFLKNINLNYLDLIESNEFIFKDSHYKKTLELWGKGNHANNKLKHDGNDTHIEKLIETFGKEDFNKNSYLEIGCGEGIDLNYVIKNFEINNLFATDIGENIEKIFFGFKRRINKIKGKVKAYWKIFTYKLKKS